MINDTQDGYGKEILPNGTQYEGLFSNGKKGPHGIVIFNDGNVYDGELLENAIHGYGRLIHKDQG